MSADCLIVGGGPAGLTAAIYLARFRRSVVLIDAGKSRASLIPKSNNVPGFARGVSGSDFLNRLRTQCDQYEIMRTAGRVIALQRDQDGLFHATTDGSPVAARLVLLAAGLTDHEPPILALREGVGKGVVKYCPVCDAYESTGKTIAVMGPAKAVARKALFLRSYSSHVTIYATGGAREMDPVLIDAGIEVLRPISFNLTDHQVEATLPDGRTHTAETLYPMLGCQVHSDLAAALGAQCTESGCLIVDVEQRTSVPGLWAAGDVVSDLHQISVAVGHAAIAATSMHDTLPRNFR